MYTIKENPEDFIVKEITNLSFKDSGAYLICVLKKKNYTTIRAIEQIAKSLNKKIKDIGFAGTKDKNAVTEQFISIKNANKTEIEKIRLKDIGLTFIGYSDKPISLGDLEGNEFIITIRNFKGKFNRNPTTVSHRLVDCLLANARSGRISENANIPRRSMYHQLHTDGIFAFNKKTIMPNFFGEQRFSKNNIEIGKLLLKSDFKKAVNLVLDTNPDYKEKMQELIKNNPNDFVGALKLIPKKLLRLYVHAYQSYLWNNTLSEYMKESKKNIQIPLIGFGTEIKDKTINKIITKIMKKEEITFRSFINRPIPEISLEGDLRDAFVGIRDLKILEKGKDFVKLRFKLPKGSYATVAVGFLLN